MKKKKNTTILTSNFIKESEMTTPEGKLVSQGDIIRIHGEHGKKFKFDKFVTRADNGLTWIDCYEMQGGVIGMMRSFRVERVRVIPKRKKRLKKSI